VAFEIGMTAAEYYDSTPAEIGMKVEVYNRKQKQNHDEIITTAYLSAYYNRVKKMPKLQELLSPKEKPRAAEQASALLSKLKEMNAQLGGEIY
jgi:hypothetical protein